MNSRVTDVLSAPAARLQLTLAGTQALRAFSRGTAETPAAARYAEAFVDGEGMDRGFQTMSSADSLRTLLAFSGARAGMAVVEVGAGTGMLTFEGGLADAVGPTGILLATDPSIPMLGVLARKRGDRRAAHVHILAAVAEDLPVTDGQADLTIGSKFLQYCDTPGALGEMRRVTRPLGTVAVINGLQAEFGPGWRRVLAPLIAAARRAGAAPDPTRDGLYHTRGAVPAMFRAAGYEDVGTEYLDEPSVATDYPTLLRGTSQMSFFEGVVAHVPSPAREALVDQAYRDMRSLFEEYPVQERSFVYHWELIRGRVPAG